MKSQRVWKSTSKLSIPNSPLQKNIYRARHRDYTQVNNSESCLKLNRILWWYCVYEALCQNGDACTTCLNRPQNVFKTSQVESRGAMAPTKIFQSQKHPCEVNSMNAWPFYWVWPRAIND